MKWLVQIEAAPDGKLLNAHRLSRCHVSVHKNEDSEQWPVQTSTATVPWNNLPRDRLRTAARYSELTAKRKLGLTLLRFLSARMHAHTAHTCEGFRWLKE